MSPLESFWPLVGDVLRLDTAVIGRYIGIEGSGQLALLVVLIAGASEALGNSLVLFINRVRIGRFVFTLLVTAVIFAFNYAFWTLSIYLVARLAFDARPFLGIVWQVVAFAHAPRIFGIMEFLPVLGRPVALGLQLWSMLAVFLGVRVSLDLEPWQALASVVLGGVVLLTLQRTIGWPLMALARWLRSRASGVELVTDSAGLRKMVDAGPGRGTNASPGSDQQ